MPDEPAVVVGKEEFITLSDVYGTWSSVMGTTVEYQNSGNINYETVWMPILLIVKGYPGHEKYEEDCSMATTIQQLLIYGKMHRNMLRKNVSVYLLAADKAMMHSKALINDEFNDGSTNVFSLDFAEALLKSPFWNHADCGVDLMTRGLLKDTP